MAAIRALTLALCGAASTAGAQDVTIALDDVYVHVAPGSQADIPIIITNLGSTTSDEQHVVMPVHTERYTFEQESSGCGPIVPYPYANWRQFAIDPIPAGGTRICNVRVDRPVDALDNMYPAWFIQDSNTVSFEIGTFTDIGIAMTRVGAYLGYQGTIHAIYRLDTHNLGAVGATNALIQLGPDCLETPLEVDMDLPGGCVRDEISCPFEGTGPATHVSLAPGESQSCLVRYTTPAGTDTHVDVGMVPAMINSETGGWMGDDNSANNGSSIDIAVGAVPTGQAPALSPWSMLVLVMTLAAVAFAARKRAR
ncbi:MAG: hypothetical protein ACRDHN_09145 [Thermomicrobiales bacterium]